MFDTAEYTTKDLRAVEGREEYSYRIQDLKPETTYLVRVGAQNAYGENYNEEQAHETNAARKQLLFWEMPLLYLYHFIPFRELCISLTIR